MFRSRPRLYILLFLTTFAAVAAVHHLKAVQYAKAHPVVASLPAKAPEIDQALTPVPSALELLKADPPGKGPSAGTESLQNELPPVPLTETPLLEPGLPEKTAGEQKKASEPAQ